MTRQARGQAWPGLLAARQAGDEQGGWRVLAQLRRDRGMQGVVRPRKPPW
jgi:hypothetical protein